MSYIAAEDVAKAKEMDRFFCTLARKYARRKPLSGMALRIASPD